MSMPTTSGREERGLVQNVKKRVSFLTGPRAKRHEKMPNVPQAATRTGSPKGTDPRTRNLSSGIPVSCFFVDPFLVCRSLSW